MQMQIVPTLMVHSNVNVKLVKHAEVYLFNVCKWQNLFSDCINRNSPESTHLLCYYFTDIDECLDPSTHSCDSNANCTNTNGSYQCKCNQGYHGNGHTCTGIYVINFRHSSCFFGVIHSRNMNKVENKNRHSKLDFFLFHVYYCRHWRMLWGIPYMWWKCKLYQHWWFIQMSM